MIKELQQQVSLLQMQFFGQSGIFTSNELRRSLSQKSIQQMAVNCNLTLLSLVPQIIGKYARALEFVAKILVFLQQCITQQQQLAYFENQNQNASQSQHQLNWVIACSIINKTYGLLQSNKAFEVDSGPQDKSRQFIIQLFFRSVSPYLRMIAFWISDGVLKDTKREFFIQVQWNQKQTTTQNNARSENLMSLHSYSDKFNHYGARMDWEKDYLLIDNYQIRKPLMQNANAKEGGLFEICTSVLPAFLQRNLESFLSMGKSIRLLNYFKIQDGDNCLQNNYNDLIEFDLINSLRRQFIQYLSYHNPYNKKSSYNDINSIDIENQHQQQRNSKTSTENRMLSLRGKVKTLSKMQQEENENREKKLNEKQKQMRLQQEVANLEKKNPFGLFSSPNKYFIQQEQASLLLEEQSNQHDNQNSDQNDSTQHKQKQNQKHPSQFCDELIFACIRNNYNAKYNNKNNTNDAPAPPFLNDIRTAFATCFQNLVTMQQHRIDVQMKHLFFTRLHVNSVLKMAFSLFFLQKEHLLQDGVCELLFTRNMLQLGDIYQINKYLEEFSETVRCLYFKELQGKKAAFSVRNHDYYVKQFVNMDHIDIFIEKRRQKNGISLPNQTGEYYGAFNLSILIDSKQEQRVISSINQRFNQMKMKVTTLQFNFLHLIKSLEFYMLQFVVDVQCNKFMSQLNVDEINLDQILHKHAAFLKDILEGCFLSLQYKNVNDLLCKLFETCFVKFDVLVGKIQSVELAGRLMLDDMLDFEKDIEDLEFNSKNIVSLFVYFLQTNVWDQNQTGIQHLLLKLAGYNC